LLTGLRVYIEYDRGQSEKGKISGVNKEESRIKEIRELGEPCNKQMFTLNVRNDNGDIVKEEEIDVASYLTKGNPLLHLSLTVLIVRQRTRSNSKTQNSEPSISAVATNHPGFHLRN
jgi:hypothetical protein